MRNELNKEQLGKVNLKITQFENLEITDCVKRLVAIHYKQIKKKNYNSTILCRVVSQM